MSRSFKMSNDVYAAMLARGFTGEIRTYSTLPHAAATGLRSSARTAVAVVLLAAADDASLS